jgi:hypothetical protein
MADKHLRPIVRALVAAIRHSYFFVVVVALFVLHAGWIALSANYPMIFDEQYHLGIIEIYSRQLSPFIAVQPPEAAYYGDITRLPSYLFHWVMSFPYRVITLFTADVQTQVIALRFISIAMVAAGLVFWRKLLLLAGFSRAITHTALLMFVLVPLVPYTAANISYDNAVTMLLPLLFITALKAVHPKTNNSKWLLVFIGLGGILTVIKYTMLPILLAATAFVFGLLLWQHRKLLAAHLYSQLRKIPKPLTVVLIAFVIAATGLVIERHAVNLVQYGKVNVSCDQVQPVSVCQQNDVWIRNFNVKQRFEQVQWELMDPYEYTKERWVPHIFNDLTVTAALLGGQPELHAPIPPVIETDAGSVVVRQVGWAILWLSLLFGVVYWRKLPGGKAKYLFVGVLLFYALTLWYFNYTGYQRLGTPLATQGRYFIPFLIPVMAIAASAFSYVLRRQKYKIAVLVTALLLFTQGAGAFTYINYSWPTWHWQQGPAVEMNESAKEILRLFIRT